MAILAANLASQVSFRIQSHVFSFRELKRSATILCLKRREHNSSSLPVRYIPKKSSKGNEFESISSVKGSEERIFYKSLDGVGRKFVLDGEAQNQNKINGQSFVFIDAQQGFEEKINNDAKVMRHEPIKEPNTVIEDAGIQHERIICNKSVQVDKLMLDAQRMAIEFLATSFLYRAFTAVELRKKLFAKRFPPNIVEALITDFQGRGLVNDSLYAEIFSQSRWSSSSWGPRRIKQALFKKGVSETDAERAVKLVFEDCQSEGEESKLGMSKVSMDHLLVQTSKQWLRGQDVPKETRKSRIIRWLQYRGFNWGVISFILKKLESKYSS